MTDARTSNSRTAFSLIELLVVIAIISLLVSILLPALGSARHAARTAVCMANMRSQGIGFFSYATDARGSLATFNWPRGASSSTFADLNGDDYQIAVHANQAIDILRRHLGASDVDFPKFQDRTVNRNFSYLVMADGGYFGQNLPEPAVLCPEDRDAQLWQRHVATPLEVLQQTGDPDPSSSNGYKRLSPFWSTYQAVPYLWTLEHARAFNKITMIDQLRAQTPGSHLLYNQDYDIMHTLRSMSDAAFPSQKVLLFDLFDRHAFTRPLFYAYPQARQPLLFLDGQVSMRTTRDARPGWDPLEPTKTRPTSYFYVPTPVEPPTLSGKLYDNVVGYYRWTRNGLRGYDFAGK